MPVRTSDCCSPVKSQQRESRQINMPKTNVWQRARMTPMLKIRSSVAGEPPSAQCCIWRIDCIVLNHVDTSESISDIRGKFRIMVLKNSKEDQLDDHSCKELRKLQRVNEGKILYTIIRRITGLVTSCVQTAF